MTNHCLLIVMAVAAVLLTATSASQPTTAYSMVEQYGFPPGIIPQGAQSYELRKDGSFEVHFSGECGLQVGGFQLHYSSRVAGNIQNDTISGLEGVKVKIVLPWVRIRELSSQGGEIRVHAGAISRSFPVSDFSVSPQC
ncbi:uncharacterized protein [Lolium perenne]|nr:uncharacterized protein LOC127303967 [Lolium perenne]